MSQLVTFLTALWLSSAAAQLGGVFNVVQRTATNEIQTVLDPAGKSISFIGNELCKGIKPLAHVEYSDYKTEPDMSKLTLVFITRAKTVTYNLTLAPTEIPKERWFNPNLPLYIFLHGFTDDPSQKGFQTMSSAFLSQGECNILALDASSLIRWLYIRSSTMVRFIGEKLASTLAALVPAGLNPAKIHLIGHSLGSHIAGFAGKTFEIETGGSHIGRISSLDPAGPCFANIDVDLRLTKDDADFVDVMHTDAGTLGLNEQIGHVDFYPNSGSEQPNCLIQTCSHSRAWRLYAESVQKTDAFIGAKCESWQEFRNHECDYNDTSIMGYGTPLDARGKYYLQTDGNEPYGRGLQGLTLQKKDLGITRNIENSFFDFAG